MTKRQAVDLSDLDHRPSNKHPACTCGFSSGDGRYHTDCEHHRSLNARLDAQKDQRPFAVRQAEAQANVARIQAEIAARGQRV